MGSTSAPRPETPGRVLSSVSNPLHESNVAICLGFRVSGFEFRASGFGFEDSGLRVQGTRFRVWGLECSGANAEVRVAEHSGQRPLLRCRRRP